MNMQTFNSLAKNLQGPTPGRLSIGQMQSLISQRITAGKYRVAQMFNRKNFERVKALVCVFSLLHVSASNGLAGQAPANAKTPFTKQPAAAKSGNDNVGSRNPASTKATAQPKEEITKEQTEAAVRFVLYVLNPTSKTFSDVHEMLMPFTPKDTISYLKTLRVSPNEQMPKFKLQQSPTMKLIVQKDFRMLSADLLQRDPNNYMRLQGVNVAHSEMLGGDAGAKKIVSILLGKTADAANQFLLDVGFSEAHAFGWPMAFVAGMAVLAIGIFFAARAFTKTTHKLELTGIPNKVEVDAKVKADANFSANGSGSYTLDDQTTQNLQALTPSINSVINNIKNALSPTPGTR
jgi:hypothetical protein